MEDTIMRPHSCDSTAAASKLDMHRDSHVISKLKPKVRIIHIFAPEIIKTDVANFRELVQRLTGKPGDDEINPKVSSSRSRSRSWKKKPRKLKKKDGLLLPSSLMQEENHKVEENENDFLNGFGEFNGFINDLSSNFPLATAQSSHMDMFGDMQLA
ncbi:VQ motif-containing protein 25 [Manihot esculenta]|uniref:VQ domain-containing protein n=1 Tax=Manihot esculenta TaxID=3983 RepID=A0A2C9V6N2_MANES|nr:VQ motif-containing protein 25 [Manihot esculenta]OAY40128.1 hypothetical protein MANES_10G152200v8 [Manihot esculenta]